MQDSQGRPLQICEANLGHKARIRKGQTRERTRTSLAQTVKASLPLPKDCLNIIPRYCNTLSVTPQIQRSLLECIQCPTGLFLGQSHTCHIQKYLVSTISVGKSAMYICWELSIPGIFSWTSEGHYLTANSARLHQYAVLALHMRNVKYPI